MIEYHSARKREEELTPTTKWRNLNNMLSERSWTHRARIVGFHVHETSRTGKPVEAESTLVAVVGEGFGE